MAARYKRRGAMRQRRQPNGIGQRVRISALCEPELADRVATLARAKNVSVATIAREALSRLFHGWA